MGQTQEELIKEEQQILDKLIGRMDAAMLSFEANLSNAELQARKAKDQCLPDTYGVLVDAQNDKISAQDHIKAINQVRDELYQLRLQLRVQDDYGEDEEELKIGLHTFLRGSEKFVLSWKMPVCRHYMLDNSSEEYENAVADSDGRTFCTSYTLLQKRKVDIFFDRVRSVTHLFPILDEDQEKVIADEFLQELLRRRSEPEFKNIVFSIQKQQGEIIQAPYGENMIVQGCAGSGKSMIMLHRLPIIIYDNEKTLNKTNLYIITPSISYIQMAHNMRIQLEIEDLKMGTLEQYYDRLIERYRYKPEDYGKLVPYLRLKPEETEYVYSDQCVNDIHALLHQRIDQVQTSVQQGYDYFGLERKASSRTNGTKADVIAESIRAVQMLINENDPALYQYYQDLRTVGNSLGELERVIRSHKTNIIRAIEKQISDRKQLINRLKEELAKIDREEHEKSFLNHVNRIAEAKNQISKLQDRIELLDLDQEYFSTMQRIADQIQRVIQLYPMFEKEYQDVSLEELYRCIDNKQQLFELCLGIVRVVDQIKNFYEEYAGSWTMSVEALLSNALALRNQKRKYLPLDLFTELKLSINKLTALGQTIVKDVYLELMAKLGQRPDSKGRLIALRCSPYLFLQTLYAFHGLPQGGTESLITIDEAQNIAPNELKMIKEINRDRVIFNLFGDVKQHVEGTKGIDSWDEMNSVMEFTIHNMQENYRNARQITEYCNRRFGLHMRAINLDGSGVHEMKTQEVLLDELQGVFQRPQNVGLSCIIVKTPLEADSVLKMIPQYSSRIHNLTREIQELRKDKWNMMTVEQSKGLEFGTVFAFSGRMTVNEKYIAYTRALDELYLYDGEVELDESEAGENVEIQLTVSAGGAPQEAPAERRKRVKRPR